MPLGDAEILVGVRKHAKGRNSDGGKETSCPRIDSGEEKSAARKRKDRKRRAVQRALFCGVFPEQRCCMSHSFMEGTENDVPPGAVLSGLCFPVSGTGIGWLLLSTTILPTFLYRS